MQVWIILLNSSINVESFLFNIQSFIYFNDLVYGSVYLAKKIGGSDDGTLYALKAINITHALQLTGIDNIIGEREVILKHIIKYFGIF